MLKQKKYLNIIAISISVFMLLTAFGCKEEEPAEETAEAVQAPPEISYNEPDEAAVRPSTDNNTPTGQPTEEIAESNGNENAAAKTPSDDDAILLDQAEKLAEIFGTFTNKDKDSYKNLLDLKQYSTEKLQKWFDEKSRILIDPNAPFYGVTTKAVSSAIIESTATTKEILVTARREEITSNSNTPKISYKVLLMVFEQEGGEWKLDGIYWQS